MKCLKFWMNQSKIRQYGLWCLCRGSTVPIRLTCGCRSVKHIYNIYESNLWKSSFENVQIIGYELCLLQGALETLMTVFCVHPIWKMTRRVCFMPKGSAKTSTLHAVNWFNFFPLLISPNNGIFPPNGAGPTQGPNGKSSTVFTLVWDRHGDQGHWFLLWQSRPLCCPRPYALWISHNTSANG